MSLEAPTQEPKDNTNGESGGTSLTDEATQSETQQEDVLISSVYETHEEKIETSSDKKQDEYVPISKEDIVLPEGVTYDDDVFGEFKEMSTSLKLKKEDAQKLVDLQHKTFMKWSNTLEQQRMEALESWRKESEDYMGSKRKETLAHIGVALNHFSDDTGKTFFKASGLGNNIHLLKLLEGVGKALASDSFPMGSTQKKEYTLEERLTNKPKQDGVIP